MKNKFKILGLAALCSLSLVACASKKEEEQIKGETIYVSPNGGVDAAGTKESPKNFMIAAANAKPGDTILMLGGSYESSSRLGLSQNGSYNGYITVKPASSEDRVIFDFSSMIFASNNLGIQLYGDYWLF